VTEEVTGIDLVQAQMLIASGASLEDVGLIQDRISARGIAVQCRVTTENPERNFAPDTGTLSVYRHSAGYGMRQVPLPPFSVTPRWLARTPPSVAAALLFLGLPLSVYKH
jgi:hypothetical protein